MKLFHSYFSDLNQVVKTRSAISKWIDIFTGISQGSTLGPLIFNIFINDLIMFFEKMTLAIIRMIILAQNYSKPSVVLKFVSKDYVTITTSCSFIYCAVPVSEHIPHSVNSWLLFNVFYYISLNIFISSEDTKFKVMFSPSAVLFLKLSQQKSELQKQINYFVLEL